MSRAEGRRVDLVGLVIAGLALVGGVWWGLTGPAVSPVFSQAPSVVDGPGGDGDGPGRGGR